MQILTAVAFSCISRHECSSCTSYGRGSQKETPPQNVLEPRGRCATGHSDVPLFIFQSRSPSPSFETSAVQDKEISPVVHQSEKEADRCRGQGKDKPRPKKRIDTVDFQTSAVLRGATNVEVIRPDAAKLMLDSKLAGLINTCVEYPLVTSVDLQVNYIDSTSVKNP